MMLETQTPAVAAGPGDAADIRVQSRVHRLDVTDVRAGNPHRVPVVVRLLRPAAALDPGPYDRR